MERDILHGNVDAAMGRGSFGSVWLTESIVKHSILGIGEKGELCKKQVGQSS